MPHGDSLVLTLVAAFVLAFVLGMVALRFRLSPLVGYLAAGVAVGPFTPGVVADQGMAGELAEIGVILLMFGVGLHFAPKDLLQVRRIAIPGALLQIALGVGLGWLFGRIAGLPQIEALLLGFALSVASTVVVLRTFEERKAMKTEVARMRRSDAICGSRRSMARTGNHRSAIPLRPRPGSPPLHSPNRRSMR